MPQAVTSRLLFVSMRVVLYDSVCLSRGVDSSLHERDMRVATIPLFICVKTVAVAQNTSRVFCLVCR